MTGLVAVARFLPRNSSINSIFISPFEVHVHVEEHEKIGTLQATIDGTKSRDDGDGKTKKEIPIEKALEERSLMVTNPRGKKATISELMKTKANVAGNDVTSTCPKVTG